MWESLGKTASLPFWQFVSVVILAWITQQIVAYRERKNRLEETQLRFYFEIVDHIAKVQSLALAPGKIDARQVIREDTLSIMLRLSILDSNDVMDAWSTYVEYLLCDDEALDGEKLMRLASNVTYNMCCEIHGEKKRNKYSDQRVGPTPHLK